MIMAAVLVAPAGALAKTDAADKRAAITQCKMERGKTKATREAFKARYHSFSRCVRQNAEEEHAEQQAALENAAKQCKAERSDPDFAAAHDGKTFDQFYGANANGRNAYGKCVSGKAREEKAAEDAEDAQAVKSFKQAARACAAERSDEDFAADHDGKTFNEFYGTNRNRRNAFGKCVSTKARASYTDPLDP
jgi:hypothetical protein